MLLCTPEPIVIQRQRVVINGSCDDETIRSQEQLSSESPARQLSTRPVGIALWEVYCFSVCLSRTHNCKPF